MVLILCALGYTMLQPAHLGVHVAVVVLQILQGKERIGWRSMTQDAHDDLLFTLSFPIQPSHSMSFGTWRYSK